MLFFFREILSIFNKLNVSPSELRGIGIQISRLEKVTKTILANALTNFLKPADKLGNCAGDFKNGHINSTMKNDQLLTTKVNNFVNRNESKNGEIKGYLPVRNIIIEMSKSRSPVLEIPQLETKSKITGKDKVTSVNQNSSRVSKARGRPKASANKTIKKNNSNGQNLQNFFKQQPNSEVRGF